VLELGSFLNKDRWTVQVGVGHKSENEMYTMSCLLGMLRPRGPCGLEAKSLGLGLSLTLSRLCFDLGLMASGLIEIGLVASDIYSAHNINALASLFLASALCPAGLVNIPDVHRVHIVLTYFHQPPAAA